MNPDVIEVEAGVFSILLDGVSYETCLSEDSVSINGETFAFELTDPRQWKRTSGGAAATGQAIIVAPMPGKIVRILAAVNDELRAGQGVVLIEAMKMQNELKAPRAARLSAINVNEGDSVNAGTVLAVLE